ncbi:unnamed protein product [Symbiodinium sp. CCMP2592]|nr:unnamed protein product [Symbiodinium sp. CCMP2592]
MRLLRGGFLWLLAASLLRPSSGDTLDIDVRLFLDSNCFDPYDELLLLDDGCYANLYTNATKAFKVRIVGFVEPFKYDIQDYTDACHTIFSPKRTLESGKCERFIGGYWAEITNRLRSSTCVGQDCSRLAVTKQRFYSESMCVGLPYEVFTYPVQNECMRASNGTQAFRVDPTTTNVTQVDYLVNDRCGGDLTRQYIMSVGYCYELYPDRAPRSFRWEVERYDATAISDAWRPSSLGLVQAAGVAAPLALLGSPRPREL